MSDLGRKDKRTEPEIPPRKNVKRLRIGSLSGFASTHVQGGFGLINATTAVGGRTGMESEVNRWRGRTS